MCLFWQGFQLNTVHKVIVRCFSSSSVHRCTVGDSPIFVLYLRLSTVA